MGGDGHSGGHGGALAGGLCGANFRWVRDHELGERIAEHVDASGRQRRCADGDRNGWLVGRARSARARNGDGARQHGRVLRHGWGGDDDRQRWDAELAFSGAGHRRLGRGESERDRRAVDRSARRTARHERNRNRSVHYRNRRQHGHRDHDLARNVRDDGNGNHRDGNDRDHGHGQRNLRDRRDGRHGLSRNERRPRDRDDWNRRVGHDGDVPRPRVLHRLHRHVPGAGTHDWHGDRDFPGRDRDGDWNDWSHRHRHDGHD